MSSPPWFPTTVTQTQARCACGAWKARVSRRWLEQGHGKLIFVLCHYLSSCDYSPGPLPFSTSSGRAQPVWRKTDGDLVRKSLALAAARSLNLDVLLHPVHYAPGHEPLRSSVLQCLPSLSIQHLLLLSQSSASPPWSHPGGLGWRSPNYPDWGCTGRN